MTDYTYSALGGDCTIQDGGYNPTYSSGGLKKMFETLSTWTLENATRQEVEDYENGRLDENEFN